MDSWKDINTAPVYKTVWIANGDNGHGSGFMEPCFNNGKDGVWKNAYTLDPVSWIPTHWQKIPSPPKPSTGAGNE